MGDGPVAVPPRRERVLTPAITAGIAYADVDRAIGWLTEIAATAAARSSERAAT